MPAKDARRLEIRAHHLLCMFGFRGLGYSPAFVENMRAVTEAFFSDADPAVLVVVGLDDICSACPRATEGRCEAPGDEVVAGRDRALLARLGLQADECYPASELAQAVVSRVDPDALENICKGCEWLAGGYCRDGIRRRAPNGRGGMAAGE